MRVLMSLLALMWAGAAAAAPSAVVENSQSRAELFSEVTSVAPGQPFWLALRLSPIPRWHTYWRNPGDSGMATHLDWTLPDGFSAAQPLYPTPHPLPIGPLMNYGYDGPASLMVAVQAPADLAPGDSVAVRLSAEWLVCEVECIPETGDFSFALPVGDGRTDPATAAVFADGRAALPHPSPWPTELALADDRAALTAYLEPDEAAAVRAAHFFPDAEGVVAYAAPQTLGRDQNGIRLTTDRPDMAMALERATGVLVLETADGGRRGYEIEADVVVHAHAALAPVASVAPMLDVSLGQAILFALIGGLILNLMPCVFPILSLKALSLIKACGASAGEAREDGLAYAAGVVISFLAVAGLLIGFRSAGHAVGWGFQLQMPTVVTLLALLLFTVGLNLAGLFEVPGRLAGVGQRLASGKGLKGSFFTGVLATVVATPCTAPFMAPALGFAVLQSPAVALAIFASLGLGLALPYLLVSFSPWLRRHLPKPGPWMDTFRQLLAFPMFLTVAWLVWVLAAQTGANGVAAVLVGMVAVAFVVWLATHTRGARRAVRVGVAAGSAALLIVALLGIERTLKMAGPAPEEAVSADGIADEAFSEARLAALRAEGRPVFVYYTAAWCITCLVNERVALGTEAFRRFVADHGITVLKADWTNRDPAIAESLARFGRNGIPLYLFYAGGDAAGPPVILPQILTPEIVTDTLRAALDGPSTNHRTS